MASKEGETFTIEPANREEAGFCVKNSLFISPLIALQYDDRVRIGATADLTSLRA